MVSLKTLRVAKGMTPEELADMLGVPQQAVGWWEHGISKPGYGYFPILKKIFGCDADTLVTAILNSGSEITAFPQRRPFRLPLENTPKAPPTREDVIQAFTNLLDVACEYLMERVKEGEDEQSH